ncbi:hypothetical protein F4809DRAFT_302844 [Biscogniauxia mediterranea]|nr:hypothetical protein F4809DRAFT_302844 [Biscogniauxia mediterranea]
MLLFLITASLAWNLVLSFFVLRDPQLLLRVLRWSASLWLVAFGVLAAEVLREGLVVNGHAPLHWDVRVAWTAWFLLVAASVVDWRLLVPAALLPLWFLSFPEVRLLLDYGLVRLGWVGLVHSPLQWVAGRPGALQLGVRAHALAAGVWGRVLMPLWRPVKVLMDGVASVLGVSWAEDGLTKLRPPTRSMWLPFGGGWGQS